MPQPRQDFPMPLFDRLVDRELHFGREVRPRRTLDRKGLRESIRRELAQLVNTRVQIPIEQLEKRLRTVIDYGIPDFGNFSARNPEHREQMADIIARTIEHYEPRLESVRITFEEPGIDAALLRGNIEAMLVLGDAREPISFATVLSEERGEIYEIDEG